MITSNARTLVVYLAGCVALILLLQSAQQLTQQLGFKATAAVPHAAVIEKAPPAPVMVEAVKRIPQLVAIPKEKCGSMWQAVNNGNSVIVMPKTCNDVAIASITVAVSDKPCDASKEADFQSLTNSTAFKGEYGFYVGQGKNVQCLAVKEIIGKYI